MPLQVALELAAFASKKGLLDLQKWLEEEVSIYRDSFASVCCLLLVTLFMWLPRPFLVFDVDALNLRSHSGVPITGYA